MRPLLLGMGWFPDQENGVNRYFRSLLEALGDELPNVTFVGRLARYQYLNMDQVVGQGLATADKLIAALPERT